MKRILLGDNYYIISDGVAFLLMKYGEGTRAVYSTYAKGYVIRIHPDTPERIASLFRMYCETQQITL